MPRVYIQIPWQERLWRRIRLAPGNQCWLWQGSTDKHGYGMLQMPSDENGKRRPEYTHRLAYRSAHKDPGDLCVLHKCDTPLCCRPDHLFLGTRTDNAADKVAKGRVPSGEDHPTSRLTQKDVLEIRQLADHLSFSELAIRFQVHPSAISRIVRLKRWRSVRQPTR